MTLWSTILPLVFCQLLTGIVVVELERFLWGHWGPILPALSVMVASSLVLGIAFKKEDAIIPQRMKLYLLTSICQGIIIFCIQLFALKVGFLISLSLATGGVVGIWICIACAGDLALTIVGKTIQPAKDVTGHFRDWPSIDKSE